MNLCRYEEDPRLREQERGNFQDLETMKSHEQLRLLVGRFYYRFPEGESGADVYDRVSDFLEALFRKMTNSDNTVQNIVIVSHGLFIRLFLMRYYKVCARVLLIEFQWFQQWIAAINR